MQVLIDGEWTDLPVDAVEFQHRPDPAVEERIAATARETWTMEGTIAGESGEFWQALMDAERRAFAAACERRMWLRHPYRMAGAHG